LGGGGKIVFQEWVFDSGKKEGGKKGDDFGGVEVERGENGERLVLFVPSWGAEGTSWGTSGGYSKVGLAINAQTSGFGKIG